MASTSLAVLPTTMRPRLHRLWNSIPNRALITLGMTWPWLAASLATLLLGLARR